MDAMKILYLLSASLILAVSPAQAEKDVWYNAAGKVVKVTLAEKELETYIPEWKQRENARLEAQRTGNYSSRLWRSRSGRRYSSYYGSSFFGFSNRFRGFRSSSFRGRSSFRSRSGGFRGGFRSGGVSVRVR